MVTRPNTWTAEEDRILKSASELGATAAMIARDFLPHRSKDGVMSRIQVLRKKGERVTTPPAQRPKMSDPIMIREREYRSAAAKSCDKHLAALLRYGVRHRVDLSMGREAFINACRQHGVA